MPKLLAYVLEARGRARPVVLQNDATQATLAYMRGFKVAKVALTPGLVNTFPFAWQNPESTAIFVHRVIVDITNPGGTATATLNIGSAASAITAANNMVALLNANAAAVTDHLLVAGAGAGGVQKLTVAGGATAWITGQFLTEAASAIVGNVYIFYTEV